ncbi:helix-turn-helix transcriptional regulator [Mesorhizobium sp. CU2]|nr:MULTISPECIES: helix-turn-helix transcriptional regulator [unclassified Mesorhizobium]TPN86669.1 helix-turn-helix transcriptional regulator [Mesorhizobium sp. CU3]TPO19930.1 helix-turn-helix transcriptional regulator [Mesorhizobium sp. CU2]
MPENLSPATCRAARSLLNWTQVRLGSKAGVSEGTVRDFESGRRTPAPSKIALIRRAIQAGGVVFTADGVGVRLRGAKVPARPYLADGEAGIIANSEM